MIKKIKNQKSKIKNNEKGFTLVELLASVIVLVAVGSVITGTISSSLRGANKTNTIENIRQNGNYALNQISKNIEYALPFDGQNTGFYDSVSSGYVTTCPFSLSPTPAAVSTPYGLITVESAENDRTQYRCTSSPKELSANGTPLIDLTSISLISCSFSCIQNRSIDIPIIKIKFELGPENSNGLAENSGSIIFETSVTIRNYKK